MVKFRIKLPIFMFNAKNLVKLSIAVSYDDDEGMIFNVENFFNEDHITQSTVPLGSYLLEQHKRLVIAKKMGSFLSRLKKFKRKKQKSKDINTNTTRPVRHIVIDTKLPPQGISTTNNYNSRPGVDIPELTSKIPHPRDITQAHQLASALLRKSQIFSADSLSSPSTQSESTNIRRTLIPQDSYDILRTDSGSSKITVNSLVAERWRPESYFGGMGNVRVDQKRRYPAVENSVYTLPADVQEQDRLELQHILYRHGFKEQFHMPLHVRMHQEGLRILDVGCGSAAWTKDVAKSFPLSQIWGVDVASSMMQNAERLPNMRLYVGNVLERLPFENNTFDGIFQRHMKGAIPKNKWDQVILELIRVLKPGGYLELCEPDSECHQAGPKFSMLFNAASQATEARGLNINIVHELPQKMTNAGLNIISEHSCSFPLGWGDQYGNLQLLNWQQFGMAMKPFLSKTFGITPYEYDMLVNEAIAECPAYQTYYNAYTVVAQKPGRGRY
ncbi:hypothetical protein HK098_004314 [Nowakowskiella sp. JEL0407]|nr:hypothetical protein HK098_004314 [Nowakowskiella sp. JEL0407]